MTEYHQYILEENERDSDFTCLRLKPAVETRREILKLKFHIKTGLR